MTYLVATGTAVPAHRYAQAELAAFMIEAHGFSGQRAARSLRLLYEKTRIRYRHSVLPDFGPNGKKELFEAGALPLVEDRMHIYQREVLPLALSATQQCVAHFHQQQGPLDLQEITHLITVSCTGQHAPGLEITLAEALGLSSSITRLAVNFIGCYAAFHALKMAHYICQAEPSAKVMVVCAELCTLHFQPATDKDTLLANALFADGAAAALFFGREAARSLPLAVLKLTAFHHRILPAGRTDMAWRLSSSGFLMRLSSYIPALVQQALPALLESLWEKLDMRPEEIQHWAVHPGGRKILEACTRVLHLPPHALHASYQVLQQYGNMSSPSILFVLHQLWQQQAWKARHKLLALGFGPGLTLEAAVMEGGTGCR